MLFIQGKISVTGAKGLFVGHFHSWLRVTRSIYECPIATGFFTSFLTYCDIHIGSTTTCEIPVGNTTLYQLLSASFMNILISKPKEGGKLSGRT